MIKAQAKDKTKFYLLQKLAILAQKKNVRKTNECVFSNLRKKKCKKLLKLNKNILQIGKQNYVKSGSNLKL